MIRFDIPPGGRQYEPRRPSPHCGRLDPHDEHDWHTPYTRVWLTCPGPPAIEGGHR